MITPTKPACFDVPHAQGVVRRDAKQARLAAGEHGPPDRGTKGDHRTSGLFSSKGKDRKHQETLAIDCKHLYRKHL